MIRASLLRRQIKRCDLREHGARDGDAFTLARMGVWSATAAFTDGADVRRDRVRLIAEETSSTVGVGAGFTALMRLDVSERVTLDLIVV